jgi:hypothetical protein
MEAAALETIREKKDVGAALKLLEHGIMVIGASSRCDDIRGALRLYDLAFVLTVRAGNQQEVQNRLLTQLRAVKGAIDARQALPETGKTRESPRVSARHERTSLFPWRPGRHQGNRKQTHLKSKPGHPGRKAGYRKLDEASYLSKQIAGRLKKWSDPNSKWAMKWKSADAQWKTSYASKGDPRRIATYDL